MQIKVSNVNKYIPFTVFNLIQTDRCGHSPKSFICFYVKEGGKNKIQVISLLRRKLFSIFKKIMNCNAFTVPVYNGTLFG